MASWREWLRASARLVLAAPMLAAAAAAHSAEWRTSPIERFRPSEERQIFGALHWRGGLVLKGGGLRFGGLSGLVVAQDGALVAVSDVGQWFRARLLTNPDGWLVGLDRPALFARLTSSGAPARSKRAADAEALALESGDPARLLVAVETGDRLLSYVYPPSAESVPVERPLPADVAGRVRRLGVEALAIAPPASPVAGRALLITEVVGGRGRETPAWLLGADGGSARALRFAREDDWSVTGADFLPGGDLLLLERRYGGALDIGMRISRVGRDDLLRTGVIGTEPLLTGDFSDGIDNMEGIAVDTDASGRVFVTLVSDNNQSLFQRTLLLRFLLVTPQPPVRPADRAAPAMVPAPR